MKMHDDNQHDEIAWQAFRYIAGEMPDDEQQRFAERLAEDQPAREAVAAAVEVAQATALALSMQTPTSLRITQGDAPRSLRWLWVAAATAACIAVMWGAAHFVVRSNSSGAQQTAALAVQWSEVREQSPATTLEHELDEDLLVIDDDEALDAAPDWMFAAVVQQQDADDLVEMPGDMESGIEKSREQ